MTVLILNIDSIHLVENTQKITILECEDDILNYAILLMEICRSGCCMVKVIG